MGVIALAPFNGIRSEITPKLLPENFAVECTNCFLDSGALDNWYGLTEVATLGKTGEIKTLWLIDDIFLHFTETAQLALAPIANNDDFYTIITGLDKPRYTTYTLAKGLAGTSYPIDSFWLGFPAPANALIAAIGETTPTGIQFQYTIAGTEEDSVGNKLAYSYVYTYVNNLGVEGPPSNPSDVVFASTDDKITLTNFESLTGTYNPTDAKVRIYRSENGSPYQFMVELPDPPVGGQWIDDFSLTAGDAIETTLYSAPPEGLKGVVTMANGMMAGYIGNDLYLSEPYQPHAWPEDYIQHVDHEILGLASIGNMLVITTERYPYLGAGVHPDSFTLNKLETIEGNLNIRSLVDIGNGAMYASKDGIVMVSAESATIVSKDIISERTWQAMNPSSIHAVYYRGLYMGFYNAGTGMIDTENGETIPAKGSFVFDHQRGFMSYLDVYGTAAYSDLGTGSLYLVQDDAGTNKVYEFNSNSLSKLDKTYQTKPIVLEDTCFTAGRIELKSGSITFELYTDGVLRYVGVITDSNVFRMPSGYLAREFQVKLTGTGVVEGVWIATSASEIP